MSDGPEERGTAARRRWWLLAASIALLALIASANGVLNEYTYDDRYIVLKNPYVHSLQHWWHAFRASYWPRFYGGDGYRPLTILTFALEWKAGHGVPWLFHAVNILSYAATSVGVFWLASLLLPEAAAWLVGACFAVNPVHVEAVANVVGFSEIGVAVSVVVAVALYVRARMRGDLSLRTMAAISVLYAVACLTKEHGIVLPALLVLAEATIVRDERPVGRRLFVVMRPFWLLLAAMGLAFLLVRSRVLAGGIAGFQPFIVFETLRLTYVQRVMTMIGVIPTWIRLLLWPARLSAEYAPPYVDVAQRPELVQLPGLLLLVAVLGLAIALWRRKPAITFAVGWVVITLLPSSNFIIPAGIILAERTLFLPSVGAMLLVGAAAPAVWHALQRRRLQLVGVAAAACVLVLGAWRSIDRTPVWHDNDRLYKQEVLDSPLAYRSHYMLGAWYFQQGKRREGEHEFHRALQLFPYDPYVAVALADNYAGAGMCEAATPLYRWAFELTPDAPLNRLNYAVCRMRAGDFATAMSEAMFSYRNRTVSLKDARKVYTLADSLRRVWKPDSNPANGPPGDVRQAGKVPERVQNPHVADPSERPMALSNTKQ